MENIKKRDDQKRVVIFLNDKLNRAWIKYESEQKMKRKPGTLREVNLQSTVEKLLTRFLKDYMK